MITHNLARGSPFGPFCYQRLTIGAGPGNKVGGVADAIVNGARQPLTAEPGQSLLDWLRADLGVTGPKLGCGEGACGACTVLIGSRPVQACQVEAEVAPPVR